VPLVFEVGRDQSRIRLTREDALQQTKWRGRRGPAVRHARARAAVSRSL